LTTAAAAAALHRRLALNVEHDLRRRRRELYLQILPEELRALHLAQRPRGAGQRLEHHPRLPAQLLRLDAHDVDDAAEGRELQVERQAQLVLRQALVDVLQVDGLRRRRLSRLVHGGGGSGGGSGGGGGGGGGGCCRETAVGQQSQRHKRTGCCCAVYADNEEYQTVNERGEGVVSVCEEESESWRTRSDVVNYRRSWQLYT
jgi:hypothetical protein